MSVTYQTISPPSLSPTRREFFSAGLLLLIFSVILFLPVFVNGFPSGHDGYVQYRWAAQFIEAMQEPGVWYPRWLGSGNNYSGSPVMLYYPPLPFFLMAFFHLFTGDTLHAMTVACLLALLLSGVTMYVFLRSFFTYRIAIFAAAFYMAAPYHLHDFYQRSALAEFWAFAWLPLILHAIYRLNQRPHSGAIVYLGFSSAALFLTHIPIAFAFALVLPIYLLWLTRDWRRLLRIGAGFGLGAGLSAIFLLPVLLERDYVKISRLLGIRFSNYWSFEEVFRSPLWQLSPEKEFYLLKLIDLMAVGLALLVFLSAAVYFLQRKTLKAAPTLHKVLLALWCISALCLFLMLRVSTFIWEVFPLLAYLQFPFRWLTMASLGAAMLVAFITLALRQPSRWRIPFGMAFALLLCFIAAISFLVIKQAPHERDRLIRPGMTLEVKEYHPVWWDKRKNEDEVDEATVLKMRLPVVAVTEGDADIQAIDDEGVQQTYAIKSRQHTTLKFRTLYFPGWKAYVDDQAVEVQPGKEGYIELMVESGEHLLRLNLEETRPRRFGKIISLIALFVALCLIAIATRQRLQSTDANDTPDDEAQ
ncbi:MAG: YfhO family protein [Acidobacteria bacterium]|nr:YfhO family protein [Acidobacteriota bacterium]